MCRGVKITGGAVLLLLLILFFSCRNTADPLAYQRQDMFALAEGEMNGVPITARIAVFANGDMRVEYLSPDSLKGVTVTLTEGKGQACVGEMTVSVSPEALRGLLLPASVWREPDIRELTERRKQGDGSWVCRFGEMTLCLDETGSPTAITGKNYRFSIEEKSKVRE